MWLIALPSLAQTSKAVITYPAAAALDADLTQPIAWTSVPNAQAYYLYVGTTLGAKDLVDSGGLQRTTYLASGLPSGRLLYARIWTEEAGSWAYTDSTFSAAPSPSQTATLTYPANGAVNADLSQPMRWTSVASAQAYYVYVGTTAGAKNVIDSGGIQGTSYQVPLSALPVGPTLYVRLWTESGGVWRYTDSTFTASAPLAPTLTYPAAGAVNVNLTQPIAWTTVANVQAYYLYVGTTLGAKDLVDSGGLQRTTYLASGLPSGRVLYARIWAQVGGVWRYTDSTFSAAPSPSQTATLTYPANGAADADLSRPLQWTSVSTAQVYYLYVGTSVGAKDVIDSGGLQGTSYQTAIAIPSGTKLYARLWTESGSVWRYTNSTFTTSAPLAPTLTYPAAGAVNANLTQPIAWTTVANVQSYYLYVGTTLGAKDLVDSGGLQRTTYLASGLPSGRVLYARIWAQVGGVWRYTDSTFSAAPSVSQTATLTYPANGAVNADLSRPLQWTSVSTAQVYYLYVGTSVGAKDVIDSGGLQGTSYQAPVTIPSGTTLYARLWTESGNVWRYTDTVFSALPLRATLMSPQNGSLTASRLQPLQWTAVANATSYYLYVGSTPGAKDLIDTGEIHGTSYPASTLPFGKVLYARIWTRIGATWEYSDSQFAFSLTIVPANLVEVGSFMLPHSTLGSDGGFGSSTGCCGLGAYGMTFNPARNSIYVGGHPYQQRLAEIQIPASFTGSPIATALSNLVDPFEGELENINPDDPNQKVVGGAIVYNDALYIAGFSYYDGNGSQRTSWFKRPTTLTTTGQVQGPSQVGTIYPGWLDRSATLVPPEWQAALGGPVLFGGGGGSINGLQSWGPSVAAGDPSAIGTGAAVPATLLLGYPISHELAPSPTMANTLWSQMDVVSGVVFVPGTSSVLFFGHHGQGNFCYGPVTDDPLKVGTPATDIGDTADNYCWDPDNGSKGGHAYPYASWVWAYDVNDLAAVKAGHKSSSDVKPYATWNLDSRSTEIQGVAYDPTTNHLFVSFVAGDPYNAGQPLIRVYSIQ